MIDFTDAPKLKKGYGGANGNKISILLNGSRWMLKFPSIPLPWRGSSLTTAPRERAMAAVPSVELLS